MRQNFATFLLLTGGLTASAWTAEVDDTWTRFRGPNGSGIAADAKPPVQFGPEENVRWKVPVPNGLSSPIVVGETLVLTAFDDGKLWTIAYHRKDGSELWRRDAGAQSIEPFYPIGGGPASSTPVSDGERIVVYFGSCGLRCYDLKGTVLWKIDMPMAKIASHFGSGVSPILADNLAILVRDELTSPKVMAVDIQTGKVAWETQRRSRTSFSTPIVWETPAGLQLAFAGHTELTGYDLKTGKETWSVKGIPANCCASPVVANGKLYFAGYSPGGQDDAEFQMPSFGDLLKLADTNKDGAISRDEAQSTFIKDFFDNNDSDGDKQITAAEWDVSIKAMKEGLSTSFALDLKTMGEKLEPEILWQQNKGLPFVPSAILYQGQYLMVKDGGIVTAIDAATGKTIYTKRLAATGSYYASPVAANGHIYFVSLDNGTVTVLKAGVNKPEVVAENPELGESVGTTPAIVGDTIYIRADKHLYAFAKP